MKQVALPRDRQLTIWERAALTPAGLANLTFQGRYVTRPQHRLLNEVMLRCATASLRPGDHSWDAWRRVIFCVGPRIGKSELTSVHGPAWYAGIAPDLVAAVISYEATFAEGFGAAARNILQSFGPRVFGVAVDPKSEARDWWGTIDATTGYVRRGGMRAIGIGGPAMGKGFNLLVIDDPLKNAQEAMSSTIRNLHKDYWQAVSKTRLEPGAAVLVAMHRWHEDDLAGYLMREEGTIYTGGQWTPIILPLEAEPITAQHIPGLERELPDPLGREFGARLQTRYSDQELDEQQRTTPAFWWNCTPAETPILMADWRQRSISELKPGDQVIGFHKGSPERRARLVEASVEATHSKTDEVWELRLESGRIVRCTRDHRWYTGKNRERLRFLNGLPLMERSYSPARVGSRLCEIIDCDQPTQRERELWSYLAGIVDGEGSVQRSTLSIAQSPTANPEVFTRIQAVLDELGISYRLDVRGNPGHPAWGDRGTIHLHDARGTYHRLLRLAEPGKADQIRKILLDYGRMFIRRRDRVVSMRSLGVQPVYALTTSTGNYVAWGFASSNSQRQQRPQAQQGAVFKRETTRSYELLPNHYRLQKPGEAWLVPRQEVRIFTTTDLAASMKDKADYFSLGVWAVTAQRDLLLLHVVRGRYEGPDQDEVFLRTWRAWRQHQPPVLFMGVESSAYQLTMLQRLKRMGVVVQALKADGDKYARALTAGVMWDSGQIFIPAAPLPWKQDYLSELYSFPYGAHDDSVDMTSYAALVPLAGAGVNIRVIG